MSRIVFVGSDRDPFDDDSRPGSVELWEQSETLFLLGFPRAAACIGRIAIERGLIEWCQKLGVWPRSMATGEKLAGAIRVPIFTACLETAGALGVEFKQEIHRAATKGNHAAHGRAISPSQSQLVTETARKIQGKI